MTSMPEGAEAFWREALEEGRLLLQRGVESGRAFFPPRIAEPGTGKEAEWFEASGGGTVTSLTWVGQKPPALPYNVVIVELDEGVRLMSRVEGVSAEELRIGMRVKARIGREEDAAILLFDPA